MKKITVIVMVLMLLVLVGCAKKVEKAPTDRAPVEPVEKAPVAPELPVAPKNTAPVEPVVEDLGLDEALEELEVEEEPVNLDEFDQDLEELENFDFE